MARKDAPSTQVSASKKRLRFLGYAMPRAERDTEQREYDFDEIEFHDVPLGAPVSFLDYDGIVVFAGSFERAVGDAYYRRIECIVPADLHRREREFITSAQQGKTFIFLIPGIAQTSDAASDLFRSVANQTGITCWPRNSPFAGTESLIPEFNEYINRHGTGYVELGYDQERHDWVRPLCQGGQDHFGLVLGGRIFFLPATIPQRHDEVIEMCRRAVIGAVSYRQRMSNSLPEWVAGFEFSNETKLKKEAESLRKKLFDLEAEIDGFSMFKGSLAYRSEPLVKVVSRVLEEFFGVHLVIDEKCIEDATLQDQSGQTIAVFEIKGVNGNFTRANVNQIDNHRERLGLSPATPGVLIMNTKMTAQSLAEKDESPHPDIIKKAVADNVLLIRTLDLLRYADAAQQGILPKDTFCKILLHECGWLRVADQKANIVKE